MRVRIEVNGHQTCRVLIGEALSFGQTVESFNSTPMQVPCCVLKLDDGRIEVVPLKTERTWTKVEHPSVQWRGGSEG